MMYYRVDKKRGNRPCFKRKDRNILNRTDTFFLVHNYNTVPSELLEYCNNHLIIDCSDDGKTPDELKAAGYKVKKI